MHRPGVPEIGIRSLLAQGLTKTGHGATIPPNSNIIYWQYDENMTIFPNELHTAHTVNYGNPGITYQWTP